jgi:lycopene beta-cyclase
MERPGGEMVRDLKIPYENYDVVIVGGGLAGMMHADFLADDKSPDLRVAIVDPDPESLAGKTFAAWRLKSSLPHRYSGCVENRWGQFQITSPDGQKVTRDFGDYCYERIPGERLMTTIRRRIDGDTRFQIIRDQVTAITDVYDESGQAAHVMTASGTELSAKRVVNSVTTGDPEVLQYFLGFELTTSGDHFEPDVVDLMDFRVDQEGDVRFVYILPFSKRQALVEFTVFSPKRIPDAECEKILRGYIEKHLKLRDFSVTKVESGAIPMTLRAEPRFPANGIRSVIDVAGGAAGMVKPSTGYSFQRNLESQAGTVPFSSRTSYRQFRFEVYDALLLRIIQANGGMISRIFPVLFSANQPSKIFSFLDQKSRFFEEIRIFSRLPWAPFLASLVVLYPFLFAASASAVLYYTVGGASVWVIPVIGLLTAGIGHGSLDHLLDSRSRDPLRFYGRYLGSMAGFLLTWFVFPPLALGFFLFQSADHFGEANWIRAIRNSAHAAWTRALAWIWGLFAAVFGVLVHWQEASPVVQLILKDSVSVGPWDASVCRQAGFALFGMAALAAWVLDRYERKVLGRAVCGLPATVLLGVSIVALPLLPGFFCFFAFWHGWDSIVAQRAGTGWTSTEYALRAVRYTFISVIGIFFLILAGAAWGDFNRIWQILFVMIGALTAAHAPVMKHFLKRKPPRFASGAVS